LYPILSTFNTEFVALAVGTMNLDQREFLLCEWSSFGLSTFLFRLGWWRQLFLWENFWSKLHLQYFFNKFWKTDTGLQFGI